MPGTPRAPLPKRNKRLERRLAAAEDDLRRRSDVEELRAFALDGTELPRHTSKLPDAVHISDEVGARYQNAVVTHNHPNEGVGLSHFDVRAAIDFDWDEIRAVDAKRQIYTYSLRRPMEGWGSRAAFDDVWRVAAQQVEDEFRQSIADGQMAPEDAAFDYLHETLKRVCDLLDWSYQRTP